MGVTAPFQIHQGDALAVLRTLPAESVHCCVTSPPYWGLRDYGTDGQIGLERTPDEYVARIVEVFREVRRVLRADGTLWLNLGDSYAAGKQGRDDEGPDDIARRAAAYGTGTVKASAKGANGKARKAPDGLKPKDLVGIPWLVAFALRADGWYLRSDIIWAKPNPMPESVTDRPTKAHEYLFMLSKSATYYYDAEAIKEPVQHPRVLHKSTAKTDAQEAAYHGNAPTNLGRCGTDPAGRNRRTVWTVATAPFSEAHFATFPPALVEPCIKAGTSARGVCPECGAPWVRVVERREAKDTGAAIGGDPARRDGGTRERDTSGAGGNRLAVRTIGTDAWLPTCAHVEQLGAEPLAPPVPAVVLDPFSGAGTTALVATRLQRRAIGIELNPEYVAMSERRIRSDAPLFLGVA